MNALLMDTSAKILNLILLKDGARFYYEGEENARRHTAGLWTGIEKLLQEANLTLWEIQAVGAVTGPGSFTGIRIGAAAANALKTALPNIRLIGLTSLESHLFGREDGVAFSGCKNDAYYALIRRQGKDKYSILNKTDIYSILSFKVFAERFDRENFIAAFLKKVKKEEFSDELIPFYVKNSYVES